MRTRAFQGRGRPVSAGGGWGPFLGRVGSSHLAKRMGVAWTEVWGARGSKFTRGMTGVTARGGVHPSIELDCGVRQGASRDHVCAVVVDRIWDGHVGPGLSDFNPGVQFGIRLLKPLGSF